MIVWRDLARRSARALIALEEKNLATRDIVTDEARRDYLEVIDKLVAQGAQAVLLACTEQSLLRLDDEATVPLIDTTIVHCNALTDFILEGPR